MSWYQPGSFNPFTGIMNGSGGSDPTASTGTLSGGFANGIGQYIEGKTEEQFGELASMDGFDPSKLDFTDSEPDNTLSTYMTEHPDASYEDILKYMSQHSEEWAEKYLDYLTERGELDRANEYTANREDTAYQRLVQDLKKAGLNPAMMYGSSASISASGSQGYIHQSEGANTREKSNQNKVQKLILAYMMYELQKTLGSANLVAKYISAFGSFF